MISLDLPYKHMNEQELCKKRLIDLSRQADQKGIVLFSDFLNLNEQDIYHTSIRELYTNTEIYGGYHNSERQMVAFIPDALCYEWSYPIVCLKVVPQYPKFSEKLTHRDILGALMNLGIDRSRIGDIVCQNETYYIFCMDNIHAFIAENLTRIKHTSVNISAVDQTQEIQVVPELKEVNEIIASNRIDCIIAKAYHLSRSEAAEYLSTEKVFINGKCITNCNQTCNSGSIVSVRGKGRFVFETNHSVSKKGKLRVSFQMYI